MDELWPWLLLAGAGALHGLNPLTGWLFVAGRGAQSGERTRTWRALLPIAVGHLASMLVVAAAVAFGRSLDRIVMQAAAAGLLAVVVAVHWRARQTKCTCMPAGSAGLALWSFIVSTGHGAGLMLVPALIPLCVTGTSVPAASASASGSLTLAIAAVGVHTAAMLGAGGVAASLACRLCGMGAGWLSKIRRGPPFASRARSGCAPAPDAHPRSARTRAALPAPHPPPAAPPPAPTRPRTSPPL